MAGIILDGDVRAGLDERLDAVQVRVQRGPVQGRVAGVIAVVDECRALGGVQRGEFLEECGEDFWSHRQLTPVLKARDSLVRDARTKRTAISIRGGEVQHAGARAAFAFVFHVDCRGDNVRLWAVVLRGEGGDVGVQGLEVTGPGIVDEVVDGFE